jgi:hypothetical protein
MSKYTFTGPDGRSFEVKGPPGLTLEQARAAFDQQSKTGSLIGLKPGSVLSAATQAAAGLPSALTSVAQAASGITGALGANIPGAVGPIGSLAQRATDVAAVGSVVSTALGTVSRTLTNTPLTAPVDLVNYAKQSEALTAIGSMAQGTVTGVLAQTKNLVDQDSDVISNAKGLGEYGLDVSQLERAGVVKLGTSSLVQAGADLTDVLKSPAVFTGKDGIKSSIDLLSNAAKQTEIQQQLMSQGIQQLSATGIPVDQLSAEGLAGIATNAAKSVAGTEALLKNLPAPPDIPAGFTEVFNKNIRDGAFAADFSKIKVPTAFKAETIPVPAENTVKRGTVDAASARVIGNDKVPEPKYTA